MFSSDGNTLVSAGDDQTVSIKPCGYRLHTIWLRYVIFQFSEVNVSHVFRSYTCQHSSQEQLRKFISHALEPCVKEPDLFQVSLPGFLCNCSILFLLHYKYIQSLKESNLPVLRQIYGEKNVVLV